MRHEFHYPLFMALLDIDRLPELMKISPVSSYERWNWASYRERDHFGDARLSLRARVEQDAANHGITLPPGKIFLLTHLRYLGYNFNPVSFYYALDQNDQVRAILAEVSNTFGETQNYWLTEDQQVSAATHSSKYRFRKTFHVSPFMKMVQEYAWNFSVPSEKLAAHCINYDQGTEIFDATLALQRRPWSSRELHRILVRFPFMTAKVVAAIHWQALRLWLKGVPVVTHPGAGHFQPVNAPSLGASRRVQ